MRMTRSRQRLVERNLGLARSFAARAARGRSWAVGEEIFAAAYLGLCLAAARFRPERGVPFSAYATLRMRGEVGDLLRKQIPLGFRQGYRRARAPELISLSDLEDPADLNSSVTSVCIWADLLEWWFARLSPLQVRLIEGLYGSGQSIRNASQWAGCSYRRARELHRRAIALLRAQWTA